MAKANQTQKKKSKCDSFIHQLSFYQLHLQNMIKENTRYMKESENRCNSEIMKIDAFFEQISYIFQDVYTRILMEKRSKLAIFKNLFNQKLTGFGEAWHSIDKFKEDITMNYNAIVNAMEMGPFSNIMREYEEKVNQIQEGCQLLEMTGVEG